MGRAINLTCSKGQFHFLIKGKYLVTYLLSEDQQPIETGFVGYSDAELYTCSGYRYQKRSRLLFQGKLIYRLLNILHTDAKKKKDDNMNICWEEEKPSLTEISCLITEDVKYLGGTDPDMVLGKAPKDF